MWIKGKISDEQTCIWFSEGYGGDSCFIKTLASRAQKTPEIFVDSIDLDEFAEKAKEYRESHKRKVPPIIVDNVDP